MVRGTCDWTGRNTTGPPARRSAESSPSRYISYFYSFRRKVWCCSHGGRVNSTVIYSPQFMERGSRPPGPSVGCLLSLGGRGAGWGTRRRERIPAPPPGPLPTALQAPCQTRLCPQCPRPTDTSFLQRPAPPNPASWAAPRLRPSTRLLELPTLAHPQVTGNFFHTLRRPCSHWPRACEGAFPLQAPLTPGGRSSPALAIYPASLSQSPPRSTSLPGPLESVFPIMAKFMQCQLTTLTNFGGTVQLC